jgi:hypothetical protein
MRFCADNGVEVQLSRVFTPEEKGHIERFFGTLNHDLFKLLPGYVGANIAERTAIRARDSFGHRFGQEAQLVIETTLSPAQLQARIDAWLADIYEQRVHSGIATTPAIRAQAFADQARGAPSERVLDALLMDAPGSSGIRNVNKKGIRIEGRWYYAGDLGALVGYRVHVRLDPATPNYIVVYTHDRKAFLCVAEWDLVIDNDRRIQIAREAQSRQRNHLRLVRDAARDVQQRFPAAGLADRILGDVAGDGFILQDDARKAMETAARPQLVAAQRAMDALDDAKAGPQPMAPTADEQETARAYLADMTVKLPDAAAMLECDGYSRPAFDNDIDLWLWLVEFQARGNALDAGDRSLFDELAASPSFQQQLATRRASKE